MVSSQARLTKQKHCPWKCEEKDEAKQTTATPTNPTESLKSDRDFVPPDPSRLFERNESNDLLK